MSKNGLQYSDSYFRYLFILMRYASYVTRRRIKGNIMLFLEYSPDGDIKNGDIRLVVLNDKKSNKLLIFVYQKEIESGYFIYLGEIRIFGYYPKQVRKILYNIQRKIRDNIDGYKDKLIRKPITISKSRSYAYKRWVGNGGGTKST